MPCNVSIGMWPMKYCRSSDLLITATLGVRLNSSGWSRKLSDMRGQQKREARFEAEGIMEGVTPEQLKAELLEWTRHQDDKLKEGVRSESQSNSKHGAWRISISREKGVLYNLAHES